MIPLSIISEEKKDFTTIIIEYDFGWNEFSCLYRKHPRIPALFTLDLEMERMRKIIETVGVLNDSTKHLYIFNRGNG